MLPKYDLLFSFLIFLLLACSPKKETMKDLPAWLEKNLPGQLDIVGNVVNLDPKNLYYQEKETILADKSDPEVQIKITWNKNDDGLDLSADEVKTMLENSRRDTKAARTILAGLKERGLDKVSVGVIDMAAYILTYEEPTAEARQRFTDIALATINALPDHNQTSIWIECMEPSTFGEHFKDIVLFGYWHRGGTYHDDKKIMSLDFEWNADVQIEDLMPHWTYNYKSERASTLSDEAFTSASAWATKNIRSPFYLEPDQMIGVGLDEEDPLSLRYSFPYFESKPDTSDTGNEQDPLGYVSVSYQTDKKTFSHFAKEDEL